MKEMEEGIQLCVGVLAEPALESPVLGALLFGGISCMMARKTLTHLAVTHMNPMRTFGSSIVWTAQGDDNTDGRDYFGVSMWGILCFSYAFLFLFRASLWAPLYFDSLIGILHTFFTFTVNQFDAAENFIILIGVGNTNIFLHPYHFHFFTFTFLPYHLHSSNFGVRRVPCSPTLAAPMPQKWNCRS